MFSELLNDAPERSIDNVNRANQRGGIKKGGRPITTVLCDCFASQQLSLEACSNVGSG